MRCTNQLSFIDPFGQNALSGFLNGGRVRAQLGAAAGPGGAVIGATVGGLAALMFSEIIGDGGVGDDTSIHKPERRNCGCTCVNRGHANRGQFA